MSELIDREAVREFIKSYRYSTDVAFHMEDHLDEIPSSSPWHRVQDDLPSMDGYDWVIGVVTGEAGCLRFHKAVMMVSFDPQYKEWFIDEYPDAKITVSHWMELPEPPKEGTHENRDNP